MSLICGILSRRDPEQASAEALDSMLAVVQHRSRDGQMTFIEPADGIALGYGHTATFGQDVPAWHQDDHYVAAVDGDIFETATHLGGAAGRFSSKHAGAVVTSYEADRQSFPAALDGVFSLFLWDRQRRTLQLSADPMALKLVYYYENPDRSLLVFSTEMKSVLAHPAVPRQLDESVLPLYLAIQDVSVPFTLVKGVRKLSAAECLTFAPSGTETKRYWRPTYETGPDEFEYWVARVRSEMVAAVGRVAGDAKKVAVYLSGGIDSPVVLAALKETGVSEIGPFTLAFNRGERGMYDAEGAAEVAAITNTPHQTIIVDVESEITPQLMGTLYSQIDEPFDSASRLANEYFLGQALSEAGFDSSLNGCETGFEKPFLQKALEKDPEIESRFLDEALEAAFTSDVYFSGSRIEHALVHPPDMTILREAALANRQILADLQPAAAVGLDLGLRSGINWGFLYAQSIPPLMGLEERSAYFDARLALTSQSVPRVFTGLHSTENTKATMREAFRDVLGPDFDQRRKVVFPRPPSPSWLRQYLVPSLKPLADDGIVTPKYLRWLEKNVEQGRKRARIETWRWFVFNCWYQFQIKQSNPFESVA